jgi:hypothetical protein
MQCSLPAVLPQPLHRRATTAIADVRSASSTAIQVGLSEQARQVLLGHSSHSSPPGKQCCMLDVCRDGKPAAGGSCT